MNHKITLIVRLFIALAFIALGAIVLYFKDKTMLNDTQTYGFAILLFVYGLFRIYRAVKRTDDIFVEK